MIALRLALRDFAAGRKPVLQLEARAILEGQMILWTAHPHAGNRWPPLVLAWAGSLASAILFFLSGGQNASMILLAMALLFLLPAILILDWHQTEYVLTRDRLIVKLGAFSREPRHVPVTQLGPWEIHQRPWQRPWNLLDVTLAQPPTPEPASAPSTSPVIVRLRGLTVEQAATFLRLLEERQPPQAAADAPDPSARRPHPPA